MTEDQSSDLISFDFEDENEFSSFIPAGVYEGKIESAEVAYRRKDDPDSGNKIAMRVTLFNVPEWGDTVKYPSYNIPDPTVEDEDGLVSGDPAWLYRINAQNLKNMYKAIFGADVRALGGKTHSEACEMLAGRTAMFEAKEPATSKSGNKYQIIELVGV